MRTHSRKKPFDLRHDFARLAGHHVCGFGFSDFAQALLHQGNKRFQDSNAKSFFLSQLDMVA
jgi:hypothetical protein